MPGNNDWIVTNLLSKNPVFEVKFNSYKFLDHGFYNNAVNTLKLIKEKYNNLYLGYSGGMDSEFILKLAIDNRIPITPVIALTPFNTLEKDYALRFCRLHNITPLIFTCSQEKYLRAMYEIIYKKLGFYNYFTAITLLIADFVKSQGGNLLTGFGDPFEVLPYPEKVSKNICFAEWDFYLDYYDNSHPSCFFTYTPELLYSFIKEIDYSLHLQDAKSLLYAVDFRPKIDYDANLINLVFSKFPKNNKSCTHFKISKDILLNLLAQFKNI